MIPYIPVHWSEFNPPEKIAKSKEYESNGRTYLREEFCSPLEDEPSEFFVLYEKKKEEVNVKDLFRIEHFLKGEKCDFETLKPKQKDVTRIAKEYGLQKVDNRYTSSDENAFAILCAKFPNASTYGKYKAVLYAMKYGDAPCVTYFAHN